jgi:hypothetical protein
LWAPIPVARDRWTRLRDMLPAPDQLHTRGDDWADHRPCLTATGVQVYVYVEVTDLLAPPTQVVSLHFDTAGQSEHTAQLPSAVGHENDGDFLGWTTDAIPVEGPHRWRGHRRGRPRRQGQVWRQTGNC